MIPQFIYPREIFRIFLTYYYEISEFHILARIFAMLFSEYMVSSFNEEKFMALENFFGSLIFSPVFPVMSLIELPLLICWAYLISKPIFLHFLQFSVSFS